MYKCEQCTLWDVLNPRVQVSVKKTLARAGPHGPAKEAPRGAVTNLYAFL